jgi:hypothetical protein
LFSDAQSSRATIKIPVPELISLPILVPTREHCGTNSG